MSSCTQSSSRLRHGVRVSIKALLLLPAVHGIASLNLAHAQGSILVGLDGTQGQGYVEAIASTSPYGNENWPQISWPSYNATAGESYPALCDVDGDTKPELIIGLGSGGDGYLEVRDDKDTGYASLAWVQVDWAAYNSANGSTRPACADLDGDNRDEICVGLGNGGGGWVRCFDDANASYAPLSWEQVDWAAYNGANGETRPALCDVDGDNKPEMVVGLGSGAGGYLRVKDDRDTGYAPLTWLQIDWAGYNSANGETRPACGDIDGDNRDEICVGLGSGGGGWLRCYDDANASYAPLTWQQVDWPAYTGANGETFPALGNVDGDSQAEIVIGLGSGGDGYMRIKDDATAGYANISWPQVHWPSYNSANGETRPAVYRNSGGGQGSGFNEQFNSGNAEDWLRDFGSWNVANGEYSTSGITNKWSLTTYNQDFSNVDYQARLKRDACDTCPNSLMIRVSGTINSDGLPANYYAFQYDRGSFFSVFKRVNGTSTNLTGTSQSPWLFSSTINTGDQWNELRVVANGSNLSFYINSELVWEGTDTDLTTGRVGIRMRSVGTSGDGFSADWATLQELN